jgi:UDP-N-acetylmuramate dehydrogenase
MQIKENEPLSPLTTFGIGGPARWFIEAVSEDEVEEAVAWVQKRGVGLFVLGGGSNLLVSDAGFDGMVLKIGLRGISVADAAGNPRQRLYQVAAGEDWDCFVERTVQDSCAGIECLAGIPGTVGGTPVQNVGAYGQEVASVIEGVWAFDLKGQVFIKFAAAECGFAYRRSRFNSTDRGRHIVTRVDFRLTHGGSLTLRYAELQRAMEEKRTDGGQPTLTEVAATVREIRRSKGMLLVDGDPDCKSAGSFFKNPVVTEEQFQEIAAGAGKELTGYPAGAGQVKLAAAWLIEQSGFTKGYELGNAGLSSRHTLALINRGGAKAADILALAGQIAESVEARFGVHLDPEPVMLGF